MCPHGQSTFTFVDLCQESACSAPPPVPTKWCRAGMRFLITSAADCHRQSGLCLNSGEDQRVAQKVGTGWAHVGHLRIRYERLAGSLFRIKEVHLRHPGMCLAPRSPLSRHPAQPPTTMASGAPRSVNHVQHIPAAGDQAASLFLSFCTTPRCVCTSDESLQRGNYLGRAKSDSTEAPALFALLRGIAYMS